MEQNTLQQCLLVGQEAVSTKKYISEHQKILFFHWEWSNTDKAVVESPVCGGSESQLGWSWQIHQVSTLLQEGQPEQGAQAHGQAASEGLHGGHSKPLSSLCQCLLTLTGKMCFPPWSWAICSSSPCLKVITFGNSTSFQLLAAQGFPKPSVISVYSVIFSDFLIHVCFLRPL